MAEPISTPLRLAVVVGGGGGVGAALVAALVGNLAYDRVIVLSRRPPPEAGDRRGLDRRRYPRRDSLAEAARQIGALGGADPDPDRHRHAARRGAVAAEKSMRALDLNALTRVLQVNAVGPALVAKHLLPLT
ncbi:hypothetical protein CSW58_11410, partial [Caulobacter sp. B11]